ncbi:hypothetical protein V1511DRAFT_491493 [Dipodascopsis uninucleata]
MLFKPWLDVKPSRHELHDDSSSDEDRDINIDFEYTDSEERSTSKKPLAGQIHHDVVDEITFSLDTNVQVEYLFLVAPALEVVMSSFGDCAKLGIIEVNQEASRSIKIPIMYNETARVHWICLPQIPLELCYHLTKTIFDRLTPKFTILLCPLFVDSLENVYILRTNAVNTCIPSDLILEPPRFITGVFASALSYAEVKQLPAICFIVGAEGVMDHEYIEDEAVKNTIRLLLEVVPNSSSWKINMQRQSKYHGRATGMYV